MSNVEMVPATAPMTMYEKWALILSAIAILIPIVQWIWKRWIQRPILKYYPTGRAYVFCNRSGSYIRIEGVFEALQKPISIKNIAVKIIRKKDDKNLNLQWATFISPVNQNFIGNYATSSETAHPFRIDADHIMCAFTEFSDPYDSAGKHIEPKIMKLFSLAKQAVIFASDYESAKKSYMVLPEYAIAKAEIEKEFYWEIGKYNAVISAQYGTKVKEFSYEFTVSESDHAKLTTNIEEVLLSELKKEYNIPLAIQTVQIEFK